MTTQLPENPFPGMDPYLEDPELWHGIHLGIIVGLARLLGLRLRPDYIVRVKDRVYVSEESDCDGQRQCYIPDVVTPDDGAAVPTSVVAAESSQSSDAIAVQLPYGDVQRQRYLEIRRVSNRELVAVVELLVPGNKIGVGRPAYIAKRTEVIQSMSHLVEIDLLRAGRPMPVIGDVPPSHYRILVNDTRRMEPVADLYPFNIQSDVPRFLMPLAEGSEGIVIDLKPILDEVYGLGSYDLDIDYRQDPPSPLSDDDRAWLDQLLRENGLRNGGGA